MPKISNIAKLENIHPLHARLLFNSQTVLEHTKKAQAVKEYQIEWWGSFDRKLYNRLLKIKNI